MHVNSAKFALEREKSGLNDVQLYKQYHVNKQSYIRTSKERLQRCLKIQTRSCKLALFTLEREKSGLNGVQEYKHDRRERLHDVYCIINMLTSLALVKS